MTPRRLAARYLMRLRAGAVRAGTASLSLALILSAASVPAGAAPDESGKRKAPKLAAPDIQALRAQLAHPLAAVREAAERRVAAAGEPGRALATALRDDADPALRLAAWRIYARRPAWLPAAPSRKALYDGDARVAVAAAEALVAAASGDTPAGGALLPAGSLKDASPTGVTRQAERALCVALADALERAPAERVPRVGLALGEGVVPALVAVAREDRYHNRIRSLAVTLLGRIGGKRAASALVDLTPRRVMRDRSSVFTALLDVELDEDARRVLYQYLHSRDPSQRFRSGSVWRFFFRGGGPWGGWAERGRLRQLVRVHPPLEELDSLRDYYRERLASRRRHPSESLDLVRGFLAVGGVEADDVQRIVDECFETIWQPRWRGRAEELGAIVVSLDGLDSHRGVLREALVDLLELHELELEDGEEPGLWRTELPRSVEAWTRHVLGGEREGVVAMATELIRGTGEVPIWSARRLGARLWSRLGSPPAALVREILADGDAWMRRQGLAWLSALPEPERRAAARAALADDDDGVFLSAALLCPDGGGPAALRRTLGLALDGTRGERGRAWALLRRAAPEARPADTTPGGAIPLDRRLVLAAAYWTHLGLDEDLPAGDGR